MLLIVLEAQSLKKVKDDLKKEEEEEREGGEEQMGEDGKEEGALPG